MKSKHFVFIGLALSLAITWLFWATNLDLRLQSLAYSPALPHWPYGGRQPWQGLYAWGTLPGLVLALGAALGWGLSYSKPERASWRYPCLYVVVLLALGPGLLINGFGKGLMGRPRPEDVPAFGGTWEYLKPFWPGVPGRGRSFLCGHCSMGFLFFGLFFLLRGWNRWAALALGLALGLGLGMARVCQGAHFSSDVLLCGSLLFSLAAALSPLARRQPAAFGAAWGRGRTFGFGAGLAALLLAGFLFSTPVYEEQNHLWYPAASLPKDKANVERLLAWPVGARGVEVAVQKGNLILQFVPQAALLAVHSDLQGFGFPGAKSRIEVSGDAENWVKYKQTLRGLFAEARGNFEVSARAGALRALRLVDEDPQGSVRLRLDTLGSPLTLHLPADVPQPEGFEAKGNGTWLRTGKGPGLELWVRARSIILN